jgi:hypothetical protein
MLNVLLRGAATGFVATIPMSFVMAKMHDNLPRERDMELAPLEVTKGAAEAAGIRKHIPPDLMPSAALAAHFGYGAAGGVLYQLIARSNPAARILLGTVFGFGVWAAGYLGYLPALGIRRSATEDPAERNVTMVAAHLVWGAFLGLAASLPGRRH